VADNQTLTDDELQAVAQAGDAGLLRKLTPEERTRLDAMQAQMRPSATSRFLSGAWDNLNPMGLISAAAHPLDTVRGLASAQLDQFGKANQDYQQGHYSEMIGHGAAGLLPVLGPVAARAGETIGGGDVAGGLGQAAGLLAPFGADAAVSGIRRVPSLAEAPAGSMRANVANALDRAAVNKFVDETGPKTGPNKVRLNRKMATVAPQLLKEPELGAFSREGLQAKIASKLDDAKAAIDDATDARLPSQQIPTRPILQALDDEIGKLKASPVEASHAMPEVTSDGVRAVPVDPTQHYALSWMKDEMESFPFNPRTFNDVPTRHGGDLEVVAGNAGAPIYREIVGQPGSEMPSLPTRSAVVKAIDDVMQGRNTTALHQRIVDVANDLAQGGTTQRAMLTPGPNPGRVPDVHFKTPGAEIPTDAPTVAGRSIGQPVEPAPHAPQLATLKQIRSEVASLGTTASYEAIRRIRQAWDQVASARYMPQTATDALQSQGAATGAMKGTRALREALAQADPQSAAAYKQFSLYKSANDVLAATNEAEMARPRVGRGIMARTTGALAGGASGGTTGAVIGAIVGHVLDKAATLAPTLQITVARRLAGIAGLIRGGDLEAATQAASRLESSLPAVTASAAEATGATVRRASGE
jgi:hypothetical protein